MNPTATAANLLWAISNLPGWLAFRRAMNDPQRTQTALLRNMIRRAVDTAFGRQHDFKNILNASDFAARVPLRDHADFEPWISRIREGEPNVLTADPVKRLATTGGSTAARKLIPYTNSLQEQFNSAIAPWIVDLFRSHPSLLFGSAYWSISPVARVANESSKVPIGFEDDSEYLGGLRKHLVNAVMAVPAHVRDAPTTDDWRQQTIEHLSRRTDLRLISVWHPSFLSLLLDHVPSDPKSIWPKLAVVSCWGDGHASLALDALRKRLPHVAFQPKGLLATEGVISIPFRNRWPLAVRSHFFEFIKSDNTISLAHELKDGETYDVAITTAGGLYRYRLHDRIRVEGFVGQTPSIRFIGKAGNISDRFGEKLSEAFVGEVVRDLMRTLEASWPFAMLAPRDRGVGAAVNYVLYIEGAAPLEAATLLDAALCANPQYAYCRDLRQLAAPTIAPIPNGAASAYVQRLVDAGQRLGDIKPTALSPLADWDRYFGIAD